MATEPPDQFGPNDWLVDELYHQYLQDRNSVDPAWWDFFDGFTPQDSQAVITPSTPLPTPPAPDPTPASAAPTQSATPTARASNIERLKGPAARVVTNMEESLSVPTATSVRSLPVKLLFDNRIVINNHLARGRGGKVSFTHIIAFALVQALKSQPEMNYSYEEVDGKPAVKLNADINIGLAIDIAKPDGTRTLLVPNIKAAQDMDFAAFWASYEDIVRRARSNKLTVEDFAGTTVSLTNPGTIGTNHSIPRLIKGQGAIIGVGSMEYPAQWQVRQKNQSFAMQCQKF